MKVCYTRIMLVDGNAIANNILAEVAEAVSARNSGAPRLTAITCSPNFETQKYLEMKKLKAFSAGVSLNIVELPAEVTTADIVACVTKVAEETDGIVVQLPLPDQVDKDVVLASVPVNKDPDGFRYGLEEGACLSPVVGAIEEISRIHKVDWIGKEVVILGEGRLVGQPATHYAKEKGAKVTVLNKKTFTEEILIKADIIVTGIGQPNFIKPNMVKKGVLIFDAGTSEDGGVLVGDVSREVDNKAALMTPVPGGIGPITIAYLLRNLVYLVRQ